jgi:ABC-type Fe3+-hydroxamate transport system substrate-binding protein
MFYSESAGLIHANALDSAPRSVTLPATAQRLVATAPAATEVATVVVVTVATPAARPATAAVVTAT